MKFWDVLRLFDNRLKRIEHVALKNRMEAEFYDKQARAFLRTLHEDQLEEDEYEELPARYRYFYSLIGDVQGKRILNCCCGDGRGTTTFAKRGATVFNIDISRNMLEIARIRAEVNGVSSQFEFSLMSAEEMGFKDSQFDIVLSLGALHHLQPELAGREVSRVLKPGGRAIFLEPLLNSWLLCLVRSLVPVECYESPGGGGMRYSEIRRIGRFFDGVGYREFLMFQRLSRLGFLRKFEGWLERLDAKVLTTFPSMRRYSAGIVIQFDKK